MDTVKCNLGSKGTLLEISTCYYKFDLTINNKQKITNRIKRLLGSRGSLFAFEIPLSLECR